MIRILSVMVLFVFLSFPVHGEQKYSISGTAAFDQADRILISLYTREAFQNFKENPLPPPPFTVVIEPSVQEKEDGKAAFRFEDIPQGTYALLAFRDQNKGAPARHPGGPASAYKMMTFSSRWDDVKFDLNHNISGIKIRFEGKPDSKQ
jgi:hypothetical protein